MNSTVYRSKYKSFLLCLLFCGIGFMLSSTMVYGQSDPLYKVERYKSNVLGTNALVNYQTGYDTIKWEAAIIGFHSADGQIDAMNTGKPIYVYMEKGNNGKWYIKADIQSINPHHESWDVDVMFFNRYLLDKFHLKGVDDDRLGIRHDNPTAPLMVDPTGDHRPAYNGICVDEPDPTGPAILGARTNGGNPLVSWLVRGQRGYSMGIDHSDDHKFKLSSSVVNFEDTNTVFTFDALKRMGLGTPDPAYKLVGNGTINASELRVNGNLIQTGYWTQNSSALYFGTGPQTSSIKVGIGTSNPTEMLEVNGKIKADGVVLSIGSFPDYVFAPEYELMKLHDLKQYLETHRHLPKFPSEASVLETGADLGQINVLLVEKVDELTLYTISQEEKLQALQEQLLKVQQQLEQLDQ